MEIREFWEKWVKAAFEPDAFVSLVFLGFVAFGIFMAFWQMN
jgi:hypothetical protein